MHQHIAVQNTNNKNKLKITQTDVVTINQSNRVMSISRGITE